MFVDETHLGEFPKKISLFSEKERVIPVCFPWPSEILAERVVCDGPWDLGPIRKEVKMRGS